MPYGVYKHKPLSEECKRKISESNKKIKHIGQFAIGTIPWNKNLKGIHLSPKSEWKKGETPENSMIFGKKETLFKGSPSYYKKIHYQISKILGKPSQCELCGGLFYGKNIHWANKDGEYKLDPQDWIRLCVKCHYIFDKQEDRKYKYISTK
jgi:hypothetical protein